MSTLSKKIALLSALAASLGMAQTSRAAIYSVTNTNASGSGSLSLALSQAQTDTNATVNIMSGLGPIVPGGTLPVIENNLVINGNNNSISGAGAYRIFFVNAPNAVVQINGLTLLSGLAQGGNGGEGYGGGGGGAGLGGAIFLNAGNLTVNGVAFSNNSAHGGAGSLGYNGGGGGGGGLNANGGAGGADPDVTYSIYVGPGGGGGALTSPGATGNPNASQAGMGGGVNGGAGGTLALSGNAGNGASPGSPDGGGGGGGFADDSGNGGNGGNGSDFGGGGGAGSSAGEDSGMPGNGGFGGGGGGGAETVNGAYGGGSGGFGGGGGGSGYGEESSGLGGTGGFGGGNGANSATGNGGGGLGAGGAVFARLGSSLTLQDCTFNGDAVVGGASGGSGATNGSAIGQALFLGANVNFYVSTGTNILGETIGGGANANANGNFIKSGAGTLVLTNTPSYAGSTIVSNGTLEIVNNLLSSSSAIISSNAVLDLNYSSRIITASSLTYTGTGTLRVDGTGDVIFGPGATYVDFSPGAWIDVEAGELSGSSSWEGYWGNNFASINVASNAVFDAVEAGFASAMQIDALTGAGSFQGGYIGNANGGLTTLIIGIAGGSGSFSGKLLNDSSARLGIVKVGAGTEILAGTNNSYAGNTIVGGGTLAINGNAGTGTVNVTNGTLAGVGSIAGSVTVGANGTIAPGWPTGTLIISNSLLLAGKTCMTLDSGANSKIAGLTDVTYGGTLTITNLGGPLAAGDTFPLFNASAWSGNFASVLGNAGNGLSFSFNPTNGVLSVMSGPPTAPTSLTYTAHSGSFTVNWPANYTGWILQTQTNPITRGLGTNWYDVAGSATVDSMTFPMSSSNCVFFRLRLPQ